MKLPETWRIGKTRTKQTWWTLCDEVKCINGRRQDQCSTTRIIPFTALQFPSEECYGTLAALYSIQNAQPREVKRLECSVPREQRWQSSRRRAGSRRYTPSVTS